MRAHAANGDRLAVQRVYQEHVGALETLDLDDAEESTTELCERLLGAKAAEEVLYRGDVTVDPDDLTAHLADWSA